MARIYKAKYYPYGDVLGAKLRSNPSYAWRSIFSSLKVIRRGTRWRVGNGKLIHIWEDKWLPTPITYRVCSPPRLFYDFPMVSFLIDEDTRRWKADIVCSLFLPFEAQTILNIPLSFNLPEDTIGWIGNNRGVFSVKNAYYVALALMDPFVEVESSNGEYRTPPPLEEDVATETTCKNQSFRLEGLYEWTAYLTKLGKHKGQN